MSNVLDVCNVTIECGFFYMRDVSFSIKKGYITGLVGREGSGKTILLRAICNAVELEAGTIKMFGRDSVEENVVNKQELGIVMEDLNYFENSFSIWENVDMLAPLYRDWDDEILNYYLKKYGIITGTETESEKYGDAKRTLDTYSRGEKARIRLAFALAHKPRLLLLDEPSSFLDPIFRREFLEDLQELIDCPYWLRDADEDERKEKAVAVILCTHTTSEIDRVADYVLLLEKGALVAAGERDELFKKYGVSNTKELVLKITGRPDGLIFQEQELHRNKRMMRKPQRGKDRFRLDRKAVPSNVEGLKACERIIYKHAKAGKMIIGVSFVVYLLLIGMSVFLHDVLNNNYWNVVWCVACILIGVINVQYLSTYTKIGKDELKELMPYLPFNIADMKVCLNAQRKRLLRFWLAVQSVFAVVIGIINVIKGGQLLVGWMLGMLLGGVIITLYSGHCEMLQLKNWWGSLSRELFVLFVLLLLVVAFL